MAAAFRRRIAGYSENVLNALANLLLIRTRRDRDPADAGRAGSKPPLEDCRRVHDALFQRRERSYGLMSADPLKDSVRIVGFL